MTDRMIDKLVNEKPSFMSASNSRFNLRVMRTSLSTLVFLMSIMLGAVEVKACTRANPQFCTAKFICTISTRGSKGQSAQSKVWNYTTTNFFDSYIREAKRRGLHCGVGPKRKTYAQLCKLSVSQIKEAQRHLKELDLYPYKIDGVVGKGTLAGIKKAKAIVGKTASTGQCITATDIKAFGQLAAADNASFSKDEAIYFLSTLVDFVAKNGDGFDLKFASEFDRVRPIMNGAWSSALSNDFERFRDYTSTFPLFQKYLEEKRTVSEGVKQKRIEQLRASLVQEMTILKQWATSNVLDAKAAQIAELDANFGNDAFQSVKALEQLAASAKQLILATGVKDGAIKEVTQQVIDSLYDPSSIYIFANTSGDAGNLYKSLEGDFTFEQNVGTYCPTTKLDAFDNYLLRDQLFETFEGLASLDSECSNATDVFVAKGNDLTTNTLFGLLPLSGLTQVSETPKAERDKVYGQLAFLKDTIKNDVLDGTRVGFGLLKTGADATKVCSIIDGQEYGHQEQLSQLKSLLLAYDVDWSGFEKVTSGPEEAFKLLQRSQCDAIYAGSLNLGRLYLSAGVADISLEFLPIWISNAAVESSQQAYEAKIAETAQANAAAEQSLDDKSKLDEQAQLSRAETAAARQRQMREENGLRFMVLKDELQDQVFVASEFGFNNAPEEVGYIKKYLTQSFVDQATRYSPYDEIIADMQNLAAERWEITEQRLDQVDYGEAIFNGRSVDALQVELNIASKNRLVGKYSEYCRRVHAIKDVDFEMWRNISVTDCFDERATAQWKLDNAFQSKWIVEPN